MQETMTTLPEAARRLGQSWERTWRALLSGQLEGEKRGGRWVVTDKSVERLARQRDANNGKPAA